MSKNYVWAIVNERGGIENAMGSRQTSMYFQSSSQPKKWVDYNNKAHGTKWRVVKFELVEVE